MIKQWGIRSSKLVLWNRKIIVTVKINNKVLVLWSFTEPESPQVLLLKSVWGFIQKSIISSEGLVPPNNCSNYKDAKRLRQHPLSYPFLLAHGPEFHMYHVYYYGNRANLIRVMPANNATAALDKTFLDTSWICWAAGPHSGFPGVWNMLCLARPDHISMSGAHSHPLGQALLPVPRRTKGALHTPARLGRMLSACSVQALKKTQQIILLPQMW